MHYVIHTRYIIKLNVKCFRAGWDKAACPCSGANNYIANNYYRAYHDLDRNQYNTAIFLKGLCPADQTKDRYFHPTDLSSFKHCLQKKNIFDANNLLLTNERYKHKTPPQ